MLRVASDAAAIRHLLQALALEPAGQPGSPPAAKRRSSQPAAPEGGEGGLRPSPFDAALSKLSPGLADSTDGPGSGLSPSSSEASDLAGAASAAGGSDVPKSAPAPRRRKASFGRQVSVMFWRTLVDIGGRPGGAGLALRLACSCLPSVATFG